jgi:[CysO sulfur-carrier protein]-S-L-cysteine hydrolase
MVSETSWIQGGLSIARPALDVVEQAARSAYERDEEACGYLEGPLGEALLCDRAVTLENLANKYHRADPEGHPRTGREYFKINGVKFERAMGEASNSGRAVKVFFHSHLDCGAYFSQEDAASMTMNGEASPTYALAYLVTAVDLGKVTAHKLFIFDPASRTFQESSFSVQDV